MNKLLTFYEKLLASLDVEVAEDGKLLYVLPDGSKDPLKLTYNHPVGEKVIGTMYLPTKAILDMDEDASMVKFHPTGENFHRGRSEVLNKLVLLMTAKLAMNVISIADALFKLAIDTDKHKHLPDPQMDLLMRIDTPIKDRDVKYWQRVLNRIIEKPGANNPVLRFSLIRNGKIGDREYSRIARINPIILRSLEDFEDPIFGIKPPNQRSYANLQNIFDIVLGGTWEGGSVCRTAPYLESVLSSFVRLATHLNSLTNTLSDHLDAKALHIDLSWSKDISKLHKWHRDELPYQFPGNVGAGKDEQALVEGSVVVESEDAQTPKKLKNASIRGARFAPLEAEAEIQTQEINNEERVVDPMAEARKRMAQRMNATSTTGDDPHPKSEARVMHRRAPDRQLEPLRDVAPLPDQRMHYPDQYDRRYPPPEHHHHRYNDAQYGAEEELTQEQKLLQASQRMMVEKQYSVQGGHPPMHGAPPVSYGYPPAPNYNGYPPHGYPPNDPYARDPRFTAHMPSTGDPRFAPTNGYGMNNSPMQAVPPLSRMPNGQIVDSFGRPCDQNGMLIPSGNAPFSP